MDADDHAARRLLSSPRTFPSGGAGFGAGSALGVLPFDWDDLRIERLDPGRGFLERSTMLSARSWEHERTLEPLPAGGTRLTDRVVFVPRLPGTTRVHRVIVEAVFRHRHRRLRERFGPQTR